ncbi:hypothetical protein CHCC20441_2589 [Bacillus licheniformis]|uniref:Uncharacterized protein n=1 Tax=Bacillus licheniformis TaxID=1402 RepID=A0A8B5YCW8_BACLI|nr:hypothetical protein MUY_001072 [Bacillus licheniformis WX-02]KYC85002.1 hypothetical protein B4091_1063 [Bacillus licheniformis]TWJ57320.1 hypothetical protein CHCC5022_1859 [Bacillus paralicheniformis]TWN17662.1 hypothetical protein CHCC14564_2227 [Bacillus licheniformis LMG 17339]TWJ61369.1 hypothetical protein CHCC5023_3132 [Bacillus paralicheniformis]
MIKHSLRRRNSGVGPNHVVSGTIKYDDHQAAEVFGSLLCVSTVIFGAQ